MKVTMNKNWQKVKEEAFLKLGVLEMITDVDKRAKVLAPKDTRALVNSSIISPVKDGYSLKFGSSRVPYARIHELGGMTGRAGTTRIRAKHYLGNAGDEIVRGNTAKYFEGEI